MRIVVIRGAGRLVSNGERRLLRRDELVAFDRPLGGELVLLVESAVVDDAETLVGCRRVGSLLRSIGWTECAMLTS